MVEIINERKNLMIEHHLTKLSQIITAILLILFHTCLLIGQENIPTNSVLNPEMIMKLTFENSTGIKVAQHKLESAKFNFKLFESEFTQFNPILAESRINGYYGGKRDGEVVLGMQKEFFDGSSVDAFLGTSTDWSSGRDTRFTQFLETSVNFPLFSSNRKLSRLIKRTFEENQLYSSNLEYVNTIRRTILSALEMYYDLVPRAKNYNMLNKYQSQLINLLDDNRLQNRENDRHQIQGEINSLASKIQGSEITVNTLKIRMQRWLGVQSIDQYTIQTINLDFHADDYFGNYYIDERNDVILQKALDNDTEFKVLQLIKKNAQEKKILAEKGKWDIFFSAGSRYNFNETIGGIKQEKYYAANFGLNVKRFDKNMLNYTIQKADADVLNIETTMDDRRIELTSKIVQLKDTSIKMREQLLSTLKSLDSWKQIYSTKLANFLEGTESVDNCIQAFRSLIGIEEEWYQSENRYLDTVRDFDFICGVYFEYLNININ